MRTIKYSRFDIKEKNTYQQVWMRGVKTDISKICSRYDCEEYWFYFYSVSEDRLYRKHVNNSWKIYTYHGGAIRNRRCEFTNLTCSTKTPTATWLTSVSPRLAPTNNPDLLVVVTECYTEWQYEPPDKDLTSYNPTEGPFSCIHNAFDSSIDSEKILLDAIKLPQDNCQAISIVIAKGTARAISDGSYCSDKLELVIKDCSKQLMRLCEHCSYSS